MQEGNTLQRYVPRPKMIAAPSSKAGDESSALMAEAVFHSSPRALAVVDEVGRIVLLNASWGQLFRIGDSVELSARPSLSEVCEMQLRFDELTLKKIDNALSAVFSADSMHVEIECASSLSSGFACFRLQIARLDYGGAVLAHVICEDVTSKKLVEQDARKTLEELVEKVEERSAVLRATNWELRQEIAHRAAAEQAAEDQRMRFLALVDTISYGIYELDLQGTIVFANAGLHRMLGYPPGSLIGKRANDVLSLGKATFEERINFVCKEKSEPKPFWGPQKTRSGEVVFFRIDWNYRHDDQGEVAGFVAVVSDVTKQRRLEEDLQSHVNQLAHVARVFTVTQMVSGLAHELNQPLAAIANYAQVCRFRLRRGEQEDVEVAGRSLEQIASQADRAGMIIRRLREFVRRAKSDRSLCDVNELLRDVLQLMEVELRAWRVVLKTEFTDDLPRVLVDRIQIEQVVANLVKNAVESMCDCEEDSRAAAIRTRLVGDQIEIAVIDAGAGIEPEAMKRLFESFYTTKSDGMGLGLSICRSIVESHGGKLEAFQNSDRGMTFQFSIPVQSIGA